MSDDPLPTEHYLDKGEFASAAIFVGNSHFTILVHPPLTPKHIMYTRGHFAPLIVIIVPKHKNKRDCQNSN